MWNKESYKDKAGVTLLEILMSMLIIGLVTGGIFTAFVFSRRISYRSEAEIEATGFAVGMADELRLAVGGTGPGGLPPLAPGIYVDQKLGNAGPFAGQSPQFKVPPSVTIGTTTYNPTPLAVLDLPAGFQGKYQIDEGTANDWVNHGDGRVLVVEGLDDLDGDGQTGRDFSIPPDGQPELYRIRLKVKYSSPKP